MEIHDHCASCYSRGCTFDLVEGVSCEIVECTNTCGQIFHQCKLEDHIELCQNSVVSCINENYGCPVEVQRNKMSLHLKTCPANIIICTMEWNRRDCGSLIMPENHKVVLQEMKGTASVDHDFDIACAAHDQQILLETIMPKEVLKHYSDLADAKTIERKESQISTDDPHKVHHEIKVSVEATDMKEAQICANNSCEMPHKTDGVDVATISLELDFVEPQFSNKDNDNVIESKCTKDLEMIKNSGNVPNIHAMADCQDVENASTTVSDQAVSTNDISRPEKTVDTPGRRKKPGLLSKLRGRGIHFDYVGMGSSANISSLGWLPRKEYRHVGTDTACLPVDKSTLEWLSPEVSLRRPDLISRIFSIIGSSSRRPSSEGSVSHYRLESSAQTVPPFLIHVDMGCIGRQLSNYSLYSSSVGIEERRRVRTLLMKGNETEGGFEEFNISKNLAFHSLGLNSSIDFFSRFSVLRRESWFISLASFMCGCMLRRDQFVTHIENVHCEIMSGLNGWLEQKCPYSAYGCKFTSFRYSPGNKLNKLVYHHNLGSFAVTQPPVFDRTHHYDTTRDCFMLRLPYDALMHIFKYLDPFALHRLSVTCKYLREMCKNHLVNRGLVEMRWTKRENASPKWICDKTIWYFPLALDKIHWVFSDNPLMAVHLEKCPVKAKQDCVVGGGTHSMFLPSKITAVLKKSSESM